MQTGSYRIGAEESAFHGKEHTSREHRIDERVGVTKHDEILSGHPLGTVRVISRGRRRPSHLCIGKAFCQRRTLRDQAFQKAGHVRLALLHEVWRADSADAGGAIGQWNEPEPAVIEPEDADVARGLARQTPCTDEMAEHGGTAMPAVALA